MGSAIWNLRFEIDLVAETAVVAVCGFIAGGTAALDGCREEPRTSKSEHRATRLSG
jgi:hypothetical protein